METKAIETEARGIVEQAKGAVIETAAQYEAAGGLLTSIKALRGKIAESCDPVIDAAHKAHRAACAQKRDLEAPLVEAEGILKPRIATYLEAEERKRREEEARLQAEAQKAAEDAALAEAEALEKAGDREAAAALIEAPVAAPVVILPKKPPKVEGVTMRTAWAAQIVDMEAFVGHILRTKHWALLGEIDMTTLNGMARSLKGAMQIPGVRAVGQKVVSSRASA